jgi:heme/copper-type cytochrome/quinol oxidase subunit 1
MHILGLQGMPRRVYTYVPETGWGALNLVSSVGAVVMALGVIVFVINMARALRIGALAGNDPWGGDTLEWATSSPPPPYNFAVLPVVASQEPLWDDRSMQSVVTGLQTRCPEVLVTRVLDASPDHRMEQPRPTIWPFISAVTLSCTFVATLFTPWGLVIGGALTTVALIFWFWPKQEDESLVEPKPKGAAA